MNKLAFLYLNVNNFENEKPDVNDSLIMDELSEHFGIQNVYIVDDENKILDFLHNRHKVGRYRGDIDLPLKPFSINPENVCFTYKVEQRHFQWRGYQVGALVITKIGYRQYFRDHFLKNEYSVRFLSMVKKEKNGCVTVERLNNISTAYLIEKALLPAPKLTEEQIQEFIK